MSAPPASSTNLENFLDRVLRRDLQAALRKRDACYNAASHCYHLRQLLADLGDLDEVRKISVDSLASAPSAAISANSHQRGRPHPRPEATLGTEVTVATSKVEGSPFLKAAYERQVRDSELPTTGARGGGVECEGRESAGSSFSPTTEEPTKMLLDLGCHFFTEVEIPNPAVVCINMGCGVVCPMSHEEAKRFLVKKERLLRDESVALSKEVLRVRFRMRLVMEAINRLETISMQEPRK